MKKDILFKTEDFVFSYRVGGLLIHDGKILLQRPKDDDYAIIGGLSGRYFSHGEISRVIKYACIILFI